MARAVLLLLAIGPPLLSGCGTLGDAIAGPADDHLYYRGVRLDVAAIRGGTPIMALDLPLSACADTLLVPSIAYHQLTDPAPKHKSLLQATGEGLSQSLTNDVIVPATTGMMKANAESWDGVPVPGPGPVTYPSSPE